MNKGISMLSPWLARIALRILGRMPRETRIQTAAKILTSRREISLPVAKSTRMIPAKTVANDDIIDGANISKASVTLKFSLHTIECNHILVAMILILIGFIISLLNL